MAKRKYRERDNIVELVREEEHSYVKNVRPLNPSQAALLHAIDTTPVTFAVGPAGTGKTYLACIKAVEALTEGRYSRIIITRPAVASFNEQLGFLPGSLESKLDPFLRPCVQTLSERLSPKRFRKYLEEGIIEFVSFAHMRGRTFTNAFIIADEVQNLSVDAMKMLVTRLGLNAQLVLCGDLSQSDLPAAERSGLDDALKRFEGLDCVKVVRFAEAEVVRSRVVADLLGRYLPENPQNS